MNRELLTVLDVMKVPVDGDPLCAIVAVDNDAPAREIKCDVLVVGGGLGGVAAAISAARRGHQVCLLEETDWVGGQATSQGVSALDEHDYIEEFGGTRSYYAFREAIRDHYRKLADDDAPGPLNPGSCWVSRIAFEPIVAVHVLNDMLAQSGAGRGRVELFIRTRLVAAETSGDHVASVRAINLDDGAMTLFRFAYVLDATELGDLLPLAGAEYIVGAESIAQTGEPNAQPDEPKRHCVQSCTYTFALERRARGANYCITEPKKYTHYRDAQPYSLRIHAHGGEIYGEKTGWLDYQVFDDAPGTKGPLWKYRRLVNAALFPGHFEHDITMFNWPGIDYRDLPLVDQEPEPLAHALQDAKRVSLGFVYWLQAAAPNPSGDQGFPELALAPAVMGSADGMCKYPYIRECRRIKALRTIVEQDVTVTHQPGARAAHFADSVGVGWYPIDVHQAGEGDVGISTRTKPFQIPLGALIPIRVSNLIAANKNIGTTHITNGCYRLHPVEWNIGEAAGTLAALAVEKGLLPRAILEDERQREILQRVLIDAGVPCAWLIDVPVSATGFVAVQRLVMSGGFGGREDNLNFAPDLMIDAEARATWMGRATKTGATDPCGDRMVSRIEFATSMLNAGLI
ncbi:MAG: FAD-dependent oxidoreductase [Candidatus Berkelbacteria bacterium]|nr:FAD-dependent oxidoreductase [Candidatus Berkelbacteria bacterium]